MKEYLPYLIIIVIIALIILLICDSLIVKIKYYSISNNIVKKEKQHLNEGIKIVYFSDLHIGREMKKKSLIKRIELLKKLDADIYIFGGDLIGTNIKKYYSIEDISKCFELLKDKCLLSVYGNHEYKEEKNITLKEKQTYFKAMNFNLLNNQEFLYIGKNKNLKIFGMQENIYHTPIDITDKYDLLISHEGDIIDKYDNQIMLSGHTHGGQIRLLLIPIFYKPKNGKKYTSGLYKVNNSSLIVSNGLGFNMLRLRFTARCDIIVIDYK